MKNSKYIRHFYFGFAEYRVSDGAGDEVNLLVNYKDNSFLIKSLGKRVNTAFREELRLFAGDLLKRKHNTDFAVR